MSISQVFQREFGASREEIITKRLLIPFSMSGIEYVDFPISQLNYTAESSRIKLYFRKSEIEKSYIYCTYSKQNLKLNQPIIHDIVIESDQNLPEDFIKSEHFFSILMHNLDKNDKNYLHFYSCFDKKTEEIVTKHGKYFPVFSYSNSPFIHTESIQNSLRNIQETIQEIKEKGLDFQSLTFGDLFRIELSKSTSKLTIELMTANTRVEELYRSFTTSFEFVLELLGTIHQTKAKVFEIEYERELTNEILISPYLFVKFTHENELKLTIENYKKQGFFVF